MFKKILTKYLLIWLTLTCILAYYWPRFGLGFDPFVLPPIDCHWFKISAAEIYISVTMLMIGSLLPVDELRAVAKHWTQIVSGTAVQYITMPLLAFISACIFHLSGPYFIGIMLVGCVPGAMASNMLVMIARGNVSYSVGLTTSATLLSPAVVPVTLYLAISVLGPHFGCTDSVNQSYFNSQVVIDMAKTLLLTVVLPVGIGFSLARVSKRWHAFSQMFGEIVANLVIIMIIASVVAANRGREFPIQMIPPLVLLNFGGFLAGWIGGKYILRLDIKKACALMIEIGMQNAGLGVMLAGIYFGTQPQVAMCCAMFTFGCMFTGIVLVQITRVLMDRWGVE